MASTQPLHPYEALSAYSEGHPLKEEVSAPSENRLLNETLTLQQRRKRNTAATVISMIYVIPYLGILIASMVALGFMASIHNSFINNFGGGKCLLYSTVHDKHIDLNTGQTCKFVIYGEAALGIVAVLLIILSVVKAVFGKWLSPILVFDYCSLILGVIFSMSVGITLSIGISVICKSLRDAYDDYGSCSQYAIVNGSKKFFFYEGLHKAEQVAWIVFGLYSLMLIVQCAMTCISCGVKYMRKKKFKPSEILYENFRDSYAAPI